MSIARVCRIYKQFDTANKINPIREDIGPNVFHVGENGLAATMKIAIAFFMERGGGYSRKLSRTVSFFA
jgi:hypothetical protein